MQHGHQHIKDMKCLPEALQTTFKKCWVSLKSSINKLSNMPKDQAHEQNNSILKGLGGIIGILENPEALRRWMVAGPEVARCLTNVEDDFCSVIHNRNERGRHHEQDYSKQRAFQNNVRNLAKIIADFGNPVLEDCPELIALDTRNCADESVVHTVRTIEEIGTRQYKKYVSLSSTIEQRLYMTQYPKIH